MTIFLFQFEALTIFYDFVDVVQRIFVIGLKDMPHFVF